MSALKPIPADAATTLPTLLQKQACAHYSVSKGVIQRWCKKLGVTTRQLTPEHFAQLGGMRAQKRGLVLPEDTSATVQCAGCREVLSVAEFPHARVGGRIVRTNSKCRTCTNEMKRGRKRPAALPSTHSDFWARDLYLQALRAFDLARSPITEDDYEAIA